MTFQFAEPLWLLAGLFAVLALAGLFLFAERRAWARLRQFAESGLIARLTGSHSRRRLWVKNSLLLAAILLLCLSLARPQWGAVWEKAETRGIDVMIALDTSRSMLAEDISPNRLERSKLAILDLLETVKGDRVGLIAFAGNAFLQCPLTLDYQAFRQTLAAVDTETIPVGGTDVASAIDEAEAYFEETGNERILILITDGEDLEASGVRRAREVGAEGTRILTVGVGSTTGELIPVTLPNGERDFLRDPSGKPVSTSLDETTLKRIADASNGLYAPLGPTGAGLQRVYEFNLAQSPAAQQQEMLQRIPIERYQWPLVLALLLVILETVLTTRRRNRTAATGSGGIATILLAGFILAAAPVPVEAGTASDAAKAYQDGRYEESMTLYREALEDEPENPKWLYNLGVSAYRAERYEEAIAQFEKALRPAGPDLQVKAFYNSANSRVALGFKELEESPALTRDQWTAALTDYQNALALDPEHPGATRNLAQLQQTIEDYTHTLTTTTAPPEAGTVTAGAEVFHRIPYAITATAADGWLFTEWSGEGIQEPDKASTVVQLEADQIVTANFVKTWKLEVRSADPEMGTAGKSGTYREDEPVPVKAEAKDYFAFSKWRSDTCEISEPEKAETEVTLSRDATVTAEFVPAFKLSVMPDPDIGGQAGPSGFFEEYSVVPIEATPRDGFEWVGWIGDGIKEPDAQQTSISLTGDRVAIAKMERIWNLVIIPSPEEGGTVEGAGNHPVGSTVDISATPAEGYTFEGWEGPGVEDPASPTTRVTVQSTEHTLFAKFGKDDENDEDNQDDQQQQDQQNQDDQQQQDQDQQQDDQQPQDQENQDQQQDDQQQDEANEQEQEQSDEQEQDQQQPEEPQPPAGQEQEEQAIPGEMTREEARQLLNALSESEKFLPASERSQEMGESPPPSGRNW
jgi:Ca-activated chloride channel family protein